MCGRMSRNMHFQKATRIRMIELIRAQQFFLGSESFTASLRAGTAIRAAAVCLGTSQSLTQKLTHEPIGRDSLHQAIS